MAFALLLGLLGTRSPAQMRPDAPIMNFRFPVFGENGYKLWELRGAEGRYLSEEEGLVRGLDLKTYSGDEAMRLENRIRSPEAHIHFPSATARGESTLFATGEHFQISGADWRWEGRTRRLTVSAGARVVIFDTIDILK
jgi:hypothetical protein